MLEMIDGSANEGIKDHDFYGIIGKSKAIHDVLDEIDKVADTDATVLIIGDTGTGKEPVARAIHKASKRKDIFIAQNCGRIPPETADSELFGHEPVFTGADKQRKGRENCEPFLDFRVVLGKREQEKLKHEDISQHEHRRSQVPIVEEILQAKTRVVREAIHHIGQQEGPIE